jgi:DNA repair protein RecO (recombination protein O)
VVLRRLSVGETDRVVTLFTRDKGKLNAIAKGARGPKSRLAAATEPFTCFDGMLAIGQNLDVLTQADVVQPFSDLRKDLIRVGYGSYFLELVDAGIEERQPSPELWDLLVAALATLETSTTPDVLARAFEMHALRVLGYEPRLHECVLDEEPVEEGVAFHPLRGGMLCPRCARSNRGSIALSPGTSAALNALVVDPFVRSANASLSQTIRGELARCLVPYVRHHLDSPLRSLQFLDNLQ